MEHLLQKSKCFIFHNIFKYVVFQRRQFAREKALLWSKGINNTSVQFFHNTMFWVHRKLGMDWVLSKLCIKGQFYKGILGKCPFYSYFLIIPCKIRKMIILWSFTIIPLQNSMVKKFGSHSMTLLYPDLCYNKACYKGTALYDKFILYLNFPTNGPWSHWLKYFS